MKQTTMITILLIMLVMVVAQSFTIAGIKQGGGGTGKSEGGETYEEMMQRMHPDQSTAKTQQTRYAAAQNAPAMVGGC